MAINTANSELGFTVGFFPLNSSVFIQLFKKHAKKIMLNYIEYKLLYR